MIIILITAVIVIETSDKPLNKNATKLVFIFSIICIVATEIHRFGHSYEVTNTALIHKKGYFSTNYKRVEFGAISDSEVIQNIWQRIFSYGDIEVHMYSKVNVEVVKGINRPDEFVDFLENKIEAHGGRKR